MNLPERLALAEKAARAAGEMLLAHPRVRPKNKAENDFVTEMDVKSEEMIRSILLGACPEDGFFGEEGGGTGETGGRWIVDPIDGTANFFKGEALYTISIAYEQDGELVVGCVFCPMTGELWTAAKGCGAFRNGVPIHVSGESEARRSFIHISFMHRNPWANEYILSRLPEICRTYSDLRRTGSAAYDLCCVADGRCEGFFELCLNIWDIAAGACILREAGGRIDGWVESENPLITGNVIATNGKSLETLRALLLADGGEAILDKHRGA